MTQKAEERARHLACHDWSGPGVPDQLPTQLAMRDGRKERLRASKARFRTLASAIPQLVFGSRINGERIWGSPQWIIYTGVGRDHSLKFGWLQAIHPDDRDSTLTQWAQAGLTGQYDVQHRIRRAIDGQYRWHQTRATPLQPEDLAASEWVGTSTDIHELKALQDGQQVLLAELQHRTRNLLAMVTSVARRSARSSADLRQFIADFESRLQALWRAESLLPSSMQGTVPVRALIEAELVAYRAHDAASVSIAGPSAAISANVAQIVALALHELATNAVKYGAFHHEAGRLHISWQLRDAPDGGRSLDLTWRETGVTVATPVQSRRRGFGSELLERILPSQLGTPTTLELTPAGMLCRITVPAAS